MFNSNVRGYVYQELKKACEELGIEWQNSIGDTLLKILWERHEIHHEQSPNAIIRDMINRYVEAWKTNILQENGIY